MKFLAPTFVCLMALGHCVAALRLREVVGVKKSLNPELDETDSVVLWQAAVQDEHNNHLCGGAIVDDKFVLTAASCVAEWNPSDIRVVTGPNNWKNPVALYEVEEILIHYNYDKPLYHNNVALIKLKDTIIYNEHTQNVTLAYLDELEDKELLFMSSWNRHVSEELKISTFEYITNDMCIEMLQENGENVDEGHLCGIPQDGEGVSRNDIGAALVDSANKLVGIGICGIPCEHGIPAVFIRVPFFSDWIRTSIKGCWLQ